MNEKSIETRLARVTAPAPDPQARLRAKRVALEEFARVHAANREAAATSAAPSKGLLGALRLFRDDSSHGSTSMAWFVRRNLLAGVASACVVGLGIAVVWPMFSDYGDARLLQDAPLPLPLELSLEEDVRSSETSPLAPEPASVPATPAERANQAAAQAAGELQRRNEADQRAAGAREDYAAASGPNRDNTSVAPAVLQKQEGTEEIVVSGIRENLKAAMETKRDAAVVIDSIQAEDIAAFPDQNVAEALQRMPGVSVANGSQSTAGTVASEDLSKIIVTGSRMSVGARKAPHKGVAAPVARGEDRGAALIYTPSSAVEAVVANDLSAPVMDEARDKFQQFDVNPVKQVVEEPVSTFSADVDTASYSFVRRQLNSGRLPQKDSVRVEEMINYFDYAWPAATSAKAPFRPTVVVSDSPWGKGRKLVHIGIKGYEIDRSDAPGANLVLLLDVSGSMDSPDKLPLAVQSMELLLSSLKPTDTVGIVVYAGAAGTVLEPTPVKEKQKIVAALRELRPGGSTAGAQGIERAYQLAESHFRKGGVNRILLATDGDFNVGISSTNELKGFVERKREKGIFLSVLGFGQGNYRDELAQALAQNGNGVAAYIDTLGEAQKVLVQEAGASLFTIAKDVKLQVEFNPATVAEYRLVGYETRALKREDFNNDAVDAGDVGSGHTVTAIYEITPVGSATRMVDKSRYAKDPQPPASTGNAGEYGFLKIRYKLPESDTSQLIEQPILIVSRDVSDNVLRDVHFSTAVAGFGQLLRGGAFTGPLSYEDIIRQAQAAKGEDPFGYRTEFVQLVRKAQVAREM
jgi:Ca-activated chloride channel homolog